MNTQILDIWIYDMRAVHHVHVPACREGPLHAHIYMRSAACTQ